MAITQRDRERLAEFEAERAELYERVEMLDELIAVIQRRAGVATLGDLPKPQTPAPSPENGQRPPEREMVQTSFRAAIVDIIRNSSVPLTAPQIAEALVRSGKTDDYKRAKSNVDTVVKRLAESGEALKDGDGWIDASRQQMALTVT